MNSEDNFDDDVTIYSSESERISMLGSVLHNNKSRAMWLLMTNNPKREYYLKEMAMIIEKDDNPRLPIYEHHIGIMVKAGIVKMNIKMHNKHKTKFYRASSFVILASSAHYEKAKTSKSFQKVFKQFFKLGALGLVGNAREKLNFHTTKIVKSQKVISKETLTINPLENHEKLQKLIELSHVESQKKQSVFNRPLKYD